MKTVVLAEWAMEERDPSTAFASLIPLGMTLLFVIPTEPSQTWRVEESLSK